jgi:hypothetical protein
MAYGYGTFTNTGSGAVAAFGQNATNDGPAVESTGVPTGENSTDEFSGAVDGPSTNEELLDPKASRMANAGLNDGAENSAVDVNEEPVVIAGASNAGVLSSVDDWRVRISLPSGNKIFYKDTGRNYLLKPLQRSGIDGVIFPYTPQIQITHSARYSEQGLIHSNFKSYFYEGSDVSAIAITGDFTAQNQYEADYVMAAVHFFRACTKMFFGPGPDAGTPPPIVFLDGYGENYLPHVSCVVTQFQHSMPQDCDYILSGYGDRVPTVSSMTVTLQPVYSRQRLHDEFDLHEYAQGKAGSRRSPRGGFL